MALKNISHNIARYATKYCAPTNPTGRDGNMPLWLTITTFIFGLSLWYIHYASYHSATTILNGNEYFLAWDEIKNGAPNPARPPIYPIFIGLLSELFGVGRALAVIPLIQWLFFIASLQIAWKLNFSSGISDKINIISIFLLLLVPGFWVMNNFSMPESLCSFWVLLTLWLSYRYSQARKLRHLVGSGGCMLILVFVKPMFIFLIPLLPLWWLAGGLKRKAEIVTGILILATTIILLALYAGCMHSHFGVFGLSEASSMNKYYSLRQEGLITPEEITDPQLRERFQAYYDKDPGNQDPYEGRYWHEICGDNFKWRETDIIASEVISNHPREALAAGLAHFKNALHYSHFHCLQPQKYAYDRELKDWDGFIPAKHSSYFFPMQEYLNFPIWGGFLTTGIYILLLILKWARHRKSPLPEFMAATLMVTAYFTAIFGAPDCWGRILTPVNMLLPIMWAYILDALLIKFKLR